MGGAFGWLGTMLSMSVIGKDGEDVKRLREQRLGDRVSKRVNKFVANAFFRLFGSVCNGGKRIVEAFQPKLVITNLINKKKYFGNRFYLQIHQWHNDD